MKLAITEREFEEKRKNAMKPKPGEKSGPSKDQAKKFSEVADKAFKKFASEKDIENELGKSINRWGRYPLTKLKGIPKAQFECYCCGWLQYYDEIVRKGCIDHIIWFKWGDTKCDVYISPQPSRPVKSSLTASISSDPTNPTAPPPPY